MFELAVMLFLLAKFALIGVILLGMFCAFRAHWFIGIFSFIIPPMALVIGVGSLWHGRNIAYQATDKVGRRW